MNKEKDDNKLNNQNEIIENKKEDEVELLNKEEKNKTNLEEIKDNKEKEENNNNKEIKKKKEKNRFKATVIVISVLILILIVFSVIFALSNINNERILNKVTIMGIDVSNMSREDAKNNINKVINLKLSEELVLKKEDYETTINATQLNAKFDVENAINEAYNIGRNGNIITNNYMILWTLIFGKDINCNFNYNEENLNKKIDDISSKLPGAVVQNSYYIEDEELVIVRGTEGISIKKEELKNIIIEKIKVVDQKYDIVTIPTEEVKPEEINLEKIRNEIYKEPKDAYVSKNPTTVHPHVNGVDFAISMEEAEKLILENKKEYNIPLKIIIPEKTIEDLGKEAFPDKLSSYTTRYDPTNWNRGNNIVLATQKIDGTIIMPGETFSYNQIVGERTIAAGYKEAGAYAGGKVVQDVGGGICQTSSTLYNTVLLANLEIVDRSNHQFLTSYVAAGKDATVNWGTLDFEFKNSRSYPIKIEASAKNGVCTMSMYGIKEETEYEVVIQSVVLSYIPYTTKYENDDTLKEGKEVVEQSGYTGCTSETYRILKLNGEVVSKTLVSKDTYDPMTRIIRRGTKKEKTTNETNKSITKEEKKETETKEEKKDNNESNKSLNEVKNDE